MGGVTIYTMKENSQKIVHETKIHSEYRKQNIAQALRTMYYAIPTIQYMYNHGPVRLFNSLSILGQFIFQQAFTSTDKIQN